MKWIYPLSLILFLSQSACDLEAECSGTASGTYTVGTDVTSDFSVSDAAFSGEVLTSDCSNLAAGTATDSGSTIDSISRSGDTITITDGAETVTLTVSGTDVNQFTRTQEFPGCNVTVVLTGTLNTTSNTIETNGAFAASGVTCNSPF